MTLRIAVHSFKGGTGKSTITANLAVSLASIAVDRRLLKNDVGEIVLNAAYLVDRSRTREFDAKVRELRERLERDGITIHRSGPWAPYSFC